MMMVFLIVAAQVGGKLLVDTRHFSGTIKTSLLSNASH